MSDKRDIEVEGLENAIYAALYNLHAMDRTKLDAHNKKFFERAVSTLNSAIDEGVEQ